MYFFGSEIHIDIDTKTLDIGLFGTLNATSKLIGDPKKAMVYRY